jgi:hypothetical protein
LVEPGVRNGTPASTITRSPAFAMPWRSAMRFDLATMSSNDSTSRVWTACVPHNRPRRRAVSWLGVSTSSGTEGRSRAIRRAVEPEVVKQMIATADTVAAMFFAASASASAVVGSGFITVKCMRSPCSGSASTDTPIASIIATDSTGHAPAALSADSMIASAPS